MAQRLRVVVPLIFASLALPHLASAQVPDSTKADSAYLLPPIEVVGSILPFAGVNIGSGIAGISTKLDWAKVDGNEPKVLPDVLQQQAGMSTYDNLGSSYKMNVSTRGFYASPVVGTPQGVSIFVDGVRVNEPDAAEVNFDLLPMEHLKRVEILSGNGALLGRNSLGGSINLVTRRGEGAPAGEIELMGGTFGALSAEGSVGATMKNGMDYYVGGNYNRENGWRQFTRADQWQAFTNFGKLGPTAGIRGQFFFSHSYAQTAGSLPESVFRVKPDSNLTTGDYEDLNGLQAAVAGYKQLGDGRGSFNFYYRRTTANRFNVNQQDDPDTQNDATNGVFGGTIDYRFAVPVGQSAVGLRFGVDGSTASSSIQLYADSTKFGGTNVLTTDVQSPLSDIAGFALANYTLGRVALSGGARYEFVSIPFRNLLDPARDTTSTYSRLDPRVGVDVDAGHGLSVFASLGTSFRAPSLIEVACADPEEPCVLPFALGDDPPMKPVTVSTFEGGARYNTGTLALTATAYYSAVKNDIFLFPSADAIAGSTIQGYFGNIPSTRRVGVEIGGAYGFGPHSVYANYAYTRATFQSVADIFSILNDSGLGIQNTVEPGDIIPLVPLSQFKAGVNLRFPLGLRAGADLRWIGEQYLQQDEANNMAPLPDYFVADLRAGWETGPWEISAVVNNVFNATYAAFGTFNINQGAPGQPIERFVTPGYAPQFRLIVTRALGVDRD